MGRTMFWNQSRAVENKGLLGEGIIEWGWDRRPFRRLAPSLSEDRGPRSAEWKQPSELGWGGCFPVPGPLTLLPLLEAWPRAQPLLCGAALGCSGPGHSPFLGCRVRNQLFPQLSLFFITPNKTPVSVYSEGFLQTVAEVTAEAATGSQSPDRPAARLQL